ncbi:MAG: TIR domain-containing protein [Planctomycetota bacterium]
MSMLRRRDLVERYTKAQVQLLSEAGERIYAATKLRKAATESALGAHYQVFLSHSYDDARVINQLRDMLVAQGFSTYVDWLEDGHLDRGNVTSATVTLLRERMQSCQTLIYATSPSAEHSVWMPWELGFMDAKTSRVVVAPIQDDDREFRGREFLCIYPYLDLTNDRFYVHANAGSYVTLSEWVAGKTPTNSSG